MEGGNHLSRRILLLYRLFRLQIQYNSKKDQTLLDPKYMRNTQKRGDVKASPDLNQV